jgi:hypothetical protein
MNETERTERRQRLEQQLEDGTAPLSAKIGFWLGQLIAIATAITVCIFVICCLLVISAAMIRLAVPQ